VLPGIEFARRCVFDRRSGFATAVSCRGALHLLPLVLRTPGPSQAERTGRLGQLRSAIPGVGRLAEFLPPPRTRCLPPVPQAPPRSRRMRVRV
jgi:hypothetical protein